jgi:site-specific DNA-methyltransferase (adenine-specific)
MQTTPVSAIIIPPDRQRKEFQPIELMELAEAIRNKGLLHAVVLREAPEGLTLVAGERRLRALREMWMLGGTLRYNNQEIPEGQVPYTTLGQLSPLEAEEAELEENARRANLTWQESAAAMARLHTLRSAQAQAAGRIHTVADTAAEVRGRSDGSYQDAVRKDLIVARHLDNPEVARAKSAEEAFKILKRQETAQKNTALAASVGATFTKSLHEVHNINCLDWMRRAPPGQFDVILTDPPYGMGADSFGDGGDGRLANNTHHYKDDYDSWLALMQEWCPLSYAVAKPEAHAYVFCDIDNFPKLRELMRAAGWYVFRTPFIHTKPNSGRVPLPDEGPRRQYEVMLYAIKGHKKTTAIYPDVTATTADAGLQHGAQKPVALYENLLLRSVRPGDSVLDCFAGSGTIFPAAHTFKCKAVGIEMNPEYYGICLQRIQDLDKPAPTGGAALGQELLNMLQR